MAKETLPVVLSSTKNVGEMIDGISKTESVVASKGISNGAKIEETTQDTVKNGADTSEATSNTSRNAQIKEALLQIRKVLHYVDHEKKIARHLLVVKGTLQALRDPDLRENGEQSTTEDIKPILPTAHIHQEDFQIQIKKLMNDNKRLRVQNESFESANDGLVCEVDTKQIELEVLEDEMRRVEKKRSQLKDIKEHLELSRKSTDDAFKLLSSMKKEDNTNQDNVITLKKELKACQAEMKAINSKNQHKGCEKKYSALVEENKHLEKRITGFKRKLGDMMTEMGNRTTNKRRHGGA
ncbi:hypothetical protein EYC80_010314 [Monilinia laxa]|uniref:Uncharacterized protein n=1 Tax=Monilinia laxa TaxID=61186 RepID=A0A5N6JRE6_MONLA|nr:hypothetical protein EYC80_010314 [Monilinia laxa]